MLILPCVYLVYRSYRLYLDRLKAEKERAEAESRHAQEQKQHAEEIANLHLRTIEALALAIEAKDQTTRDHLQRVEVYATGIGRELGLDGEELRALRAAAMLHDIGKLAVPEHIISKPGKLTPEEFEKMKIHPVVGAEILEQVRFPYPVAPIVRSHHEKWDGTGYPDGLSGEWIPIGARILAAVDCLDALASDRQYRRALPLKEALAVVVAQSGIAFDPRVVAVLRERCAELEMSARSVPASALAKLSTGARIENGRAPAAGFQEERRSSGGAEFVVSIAAARQEAQTIFEMTRDLGTSLSLSETFSVMSGRLRKLVPFDAIAVYVKVGDRLIPEYVTGEDARLFEKLAIPMGQGLSGWVAENRTHIVNGNPSVEPGYLNDSRNVTALRSALAVPLEGTEAAVGVLALYRREKDAFSKDDARVLLAVASKLGISVENAMRFEEVEISSVTDYLTELPNGRSLFLHLEREISKCRESAIDLSVLVCDLDGFKGINDRHGHLEGNEFLRRVSRVLKASCRDGDYVARMGGDEFVLVIPRAPAAAIEDIALELRAAVERTAMEMFGAAEVSMSVGFAYLGKDGTQAEELLARADKRMYGRKSAAPNRRDRRLTVVAVPA